MQRTVFLKSECLGKYTGKRRKLGRSNVRMTLEDIAEFEYEPKALRFLMEIVFTALLLSATCATKANTRSVIFEIKLIIGVPTIAANRDSVREVI